MNALIVRSLAEGKAAELNDAARDYLTGEDMCPGIVPALVLHGLTDEAGRLTDFGADVARALLDECEPVVREWTDADSDMLSAHMVALDGHKMRLRGAELNEAIMLLARRGVSAKEAGRRLGVSSERCGQIARALGVSFDYRERTLPIEEVNRRINASRRMTPVMWREAW